LNKKFEIIWEGKRKKFGQKKQKTKKTSPSFFLGSRGRASSPSAKLTALGEATSFPECRSLALGEEALPREFFMALGEEFFFISSSNGAVCLGRQGTLFFPECCARGRILFLSVILPRVPGSLQHSGKPLFPECNSSPRATLREDWVPRVLDFWLSGKPLTLGKFRFSRSEIKTASGTETETAQRLQSHMFTCIQVWN